MKSIKNMMMRRGSQKDKESFPLQHLTEDVTDEIINKESIASQIYELLDFYKVHKKSVNQVYLEKFS